MKVHNPNNLPTIPIADLLPTQGNLKDLSETNYKKLKNTIERRGFSYPVYVWEDNDKLLHLLDGHQRQRVLNTEGWNDPIPYLKVPAKDLQEAMARLLEITSQYATITQEGIDEFIATYELNEAEVYEATSFDALGKYGDDEVEVEEDEAPEVSSEPAISKLGEIYQLGRHKIMCGDSTDAGNVALLMDGVKADMVFTDPPYELTTQGGGVLKKSNSMKQIDENGVGSFDPTRLSPYAKVHVFFHNKPLIGAYIELSKLWKMSYDLAVYKKQGLPNYKGHLMTDIEYIAIIGKLDPNKGLPMELYSKVYEGKKDSDNELSYSKPVELCAKFIKLYSDNNVLDLFLGSGSTLIACEQTNRICYGCELDEKYVDVIRKRYHKFTHDNNEEGWEDGTPAIAGGEQVS